MELNSVTGEAVAEEEDATLVASAEVQDVIERSCIGLPKRDRIGHTIAVLLNAVDASQDLPKPMKRFMHDLLGGQKPSKYISPAMLRQKELISRHKTTGLVKSTDEEYKELNDLAVELSKATVGTMLTHLNWAGWSKKERIDIVMGIAVLHTALLLDADKDGEIQEFGGTCQSMYAMLNNLKQTLPMPK